MTAAAPTGQEEATRDRLYRKVALRVIPLLIVCYVANSIDRTNINMAQLSMMGDLGFDARIYGIGVGIFFFGYILFEVPSNLMLDRIGVRKTLLRIMGVWGVFSIATMFVQTPLQFYCVRFLLGAAEAGFFPGILFYITYWFPSHRRARITALFLIGAPLAGMVGAPLSGMIIPAFDRVAGLHGWQWMFLLEGAPAVLLGVAAFLYLDDRPADARWLTADEKRLIEQDLLAEGAVKAHGHDYSYRRMMRDPRVYLLGLVTVGAYTLSSASSFWGPLLIQASGVKSTTHIGFLAAIPPMTAVVAMLVYARHSDRKRERRWHYACGQFVGALGLVAAAQFYEDTVAVITSMSLVTCGVYAATAVFANIPALYLSESTRAGGLALMTSIGAIASVFAPAIMGWLRMQTGSFTLGLQVSAAVVAAGAVLLLLSIPASALRETKTHPGGD